MFEDPGANDVHQILPSPASSSQGAREGTAVAAARKNVAVASGKEPLGVRTPWPHKDLPMLAPQMPPNKEGTTL
jgi:hypothetical protein